jgi:hypothetical protein
LRKLKWQSIAAFFAKSIAIATAETPIATTAATVTAFATTAVAAATTTTAAAAVAAATTTATAEAATASATATATATEATGALFFRTRFIDAKLAAAEFLAIETVDGCLHFIGRAHRDEGKAAGTTGDAIHRKEDIGYGAELREEGLDVLLSGAKGQIAHIHFGIHV